ncbi:hypothetical protein [Nocardia pneumoniae]|uniref:hypothetical protein n=1 Tax=Nocardia pneumoniae TaxID=228601 RepID=UPI0002FAF8BF|nr:hypothetical protein [Nocardia pneumoniae]
MSHSWFAAASEISGLAGVVRPVVVPGVADAVVEDALPVGAGLGSLPHAVKAAAAKTPAISRELREIQRLYGIGTSGRVGIVGIESAIDFADRPEPVCSAGNSSAERFQRSAGQRDACAPPGR